MATFLVANLNFYNTSAHQTMVHLHCFIRLLGWKNNTCMVIKELNAGIDPSNLNLPIMVQINHILLIIYWRGPLIAQTDQYFSIDYPQSGVGTGPSEVFFERQMANSS